MVWEQLLPRAVCARVCLNDSSGVADLQPWPRTADGVGLHLELCQGERFLFHCWSCVVSGGGPVSAVNASTKHPWRKTGFQSAFIEVSRKKDLYQGYKSFFRKKILLLAKADHRTGQSFCPCCSTAALPGSAWNSVPALLPQLWEAAASQMTEPVCARVRGCSCGCLWVCSV